MNVGDDIIDFIQKLYQSKGSISLHEPRFFGNEKKYLNEAIDSTYVSSVGPFVERVEHDMAALAGTNYAVAVVNGTSALHLALLCAGVRQNDLVITQSLSFIATANAISYAGAIPVFIDVESRSMGMNPHSLLQWLEENVEVKNENCICKTSGRRIGAVVPMHSYGHPCQIKEIKEICLEYHLPLIEDAAEAVGSYYEKQHCGSFGLAGVYSFNGNKTITAGGGGVIVTNDKEFAQKAKHLSTQAKVPHKWEFVHDEVGFNYRMPNINAALLCAQLEQLPDYIENKRSLALQYRDFFKTIPEILFKAEPEKSKSNYWLNTIQFKTKTLRDLFLENSNEKGIMTRPTWRPLHKLSMYCKCPKGSLATTEILASTLVNIPSSVRL